MVVVVGFLVKEGLSEVCWQRARSCRERVFERQNMLIYGGSGGEMMKRDPNVRNNGEKRRHRLG